MIIIPASYPAETIFLRTGSSEALKLSFLIIYNDNLGFQLRYSNRHGFLYISIATANLLGAAESCFFSRSFLFCDTHFTLKQALSNSVATF